MFFDCPYDTHFECYNHKQIYFVKTSSKRLKLRYSYSILFVFIEIFWCHHVARALYLYRKPPKNIPEEKTLVLISAKNSWQTLFFSYPRKDDQAIDLIRDIWTVKGFGPTKNRPSLVLYHNLEHLFKQKSGKSRNYYQITSKIKLI